MCQNFARNWLVPLSGCYSGTYVHSPALNIDKDPYELSVTSECGGGPKISPKRYNMIIYSPWWLCRGVEVSYQYYITVWFIKGVYKTLYKWKPFTVWHNESVAGVGKHAPFNPIPIAHIIHNFPMVFSISDVHTIDSLIFWNSWNICCEECRKYWKFGNF